MKRYDNGIIIKNNSKKYKDYFEKRGVDFINHYTVSKYNYPSDEELEKISFVHHVWTIGDRYWKLASKYYNNPHYWWIIALINRKPTEAYIKGGDVIFIPSSLQQILGILKI
jgi:nucleoid-associated protein YgaU